MKIVISDFDETLYYRDTISDADRQAIEEFRAGGNRFGIITGRGMGSILGALKNQDFCPDFVICCSGGIILDRERGMLRAFHGGGAVLPDLFAVAVKYGANFFTVTDGLYEYRADMSEFIKNDFSRMFSYTQCHAAFDSPAIAEKFAGEVRRFYGSKVAVYVTEDRVNIPPVEVNKLRGIDIYHEYVGSSAKVYTVGDRAYDIPMLLAYDGYAVSNASPDTRAAAPHICDRVADMLHGL